MSAVEFDLDAYLARIELSLAEGFVADIPLLHRLHRAQALRIPFENFDICLGKPIKLDAQSLQGKLVRQRRGGYCFEVNGLLLLALQALGYEARVLLCRVHTNGQSTGRTHQICLVKVAGQDWLLDVGFGSNTPTVPLPFEMGVKISGFGMHYRLTKDNELGYVLSCLAEADTASQPLYSFDLGHVTPADIELGNYFTSTSPESFFTSARVAVLPVTDGQVVLLDDCLKLRRDGKETQLPLADDVSYLQALQEYLGIYLDVDYAELKPLFNSVN